MKPVLKNQRGVAAVEFALVLPVLLLILFGIIEFGFLLYDQAVITNASREGARSGVVYAIRHDASGKTAAESSATAKSNLVISLGTGSNPTGCSTNPCAEAENLDPGGISEFESGDRLEVTVSYKFQSFLLNPIIGEKLLTAKTVMTYE